MQTRFRVRAVTLLAVAGLLAAGLSACGGSKKSMQPPPDPVTMALKAPGVRTVVIPKQRAGLTLVVPPCGAADVKQETTKTPPGSNQIVVPKSALDQTVAIQPCILGAPQAEGANTVLLSPGGAGTPPSTGQEQGQPQNQLLLPKSSNLTKVIVPPCIVQASSSGTSSGGLSSGGTNTALPAARGKTTVTAPPCKVAMTSSSSG